MKLLTTKQAAEMLGYTENTINTSRNTGKLGGKDAPKHITLGTRTIRYRLSDLEAWASQFNEPF